MTNHREVLVAALAGIAYPARRWQLIAWADYNCASLSTRDLLGRLPEAVIYRNLGQVLEHVEKLTAALGTEAG